MSKLLKISFGWGFFLWGIGYILGILFFPFLPSHLLGWGIMPFGIGIALLVLFKKIHISSLYQYLFLSVIWLMIAVVCDYFFLVKVFKPTDGYYKIDVYLYYALTFLLPLLVGWLKQSKKTH